MTRDMASKEEWAWPVADRARIQSQQYVRTIYRVEVLDQAVTLPGGLSPGGVQVMGDAAGNSLSAEGGEKAADEGNGTDEAAEEFYVIRLSAQSFALHQIRKMVGMVLCVLHGSTPEAALDIALASHFLVHVPLAPPEGLILQNAGFWDDKKRMYRLDMRKRHTDVMREYKEKEIYPHIASILTKPQKVKKVKAGEEPRSEIIFPGFFAQLGVYRFPDPEKGWSLLESEFTRWKGLQAKARADYEEEMAARALTQPEAVKPGPDGTGPPQGKKKGASDPRWKDKDGEGADLPQGLMTAICVKYQLFPSPATMELRRRLLNAVARKDITAGSKGGLTAGLEGYVASQRLQYEAFFAYIDQNETTLLDETAKYCTLEAVKPP